MKNLAEDLWERVSKKRCELLNELKSARSIKIEDLTIENLEATKANIKRIEQKLAKIKIATSKLI